MVERIGPIGGPHELIQPGKTTGAGENQGPSFKDVLQESLKQVNDLQTHKAEKIEELVTGKETSIEQVMIAVEEANIAFEMTMQVRNRLVEAYREIMRMQV